MNNSPRRRGLAAPYALPAGFAAMLTIGAAAAALHGRLQAGAVLALAAIVVVVGAMVAEPAVAPLLGGIGWLTAVGFAGPPYGQLRPTGPLAWHAVVVMGSCAVAGAAIGLVVRRVASSYTLWIVDVPGDAWPAGAADPGIPAGQPGALQPAASQPAAPQPDAGDAGVPERSTAMPGSPEPGPGWRGRRLPSLSGGIGTRRRLAGVLLAAGLPLLTAALVAGLAESRPGR